MKENDFESFREADAQLVAVAKDIKILSRLAWPPGMATTFLEAWRKGEPRIPEPPEVRRGFAEEIPILERLARPLGDHPVARYLAVTADSYLHAAHLINSAGTPAFTELSRELYGCPTASLAEGCVANLDAARHLLKAANELSGLAQGNGTATLSADAVREEMLKQLSGFFIEDPVGVVIDDGLASLAAAGAAGVRLRAGATFSSADVQQLVHHEVFVHTATALNGRKQNRLRSLGLAAPRSTATQEGLATFAEFITTSIDLERLRRLALRVVGTALALEGADFVQVFESFLEGGQSEVESFYSTMRCFRGGDPRGGLAFTKDVVYLGGLVETHTFLLTALKERDVEAVSDLFAGRMTWGDTLELKPCFRSGLIEQPRYLPKWAEELDRLAAYLAFSNLTHELRRLETPGDCS